MILRLAVAMSFSGGLSRVIALLGIVGVSIGVCGVLLTLGVFKGFQKELRKKILSSSPHVVVSFISQEREPKLRQEFEKILRFESYQGFVAYGGRIMSVSLRAMKEPEIKMHFGKDLNGGILIGEGLMGILGANLGQEVMLINAFSYPPKVKRVLISGSFKKGSIEQDYASVVLSPKVAREIFTNPLISYEIYLKDPFKAQIVRESLERELGDIAIVRSWIDLNRGLFEALELERRVAGAVVFIVVIVGSFSIVSLILTKIREKARDFVVLSLFGMGKFEIFLTVFIQGVMVSFIGAFLGLLLGFGLAEFITKYELIKIPKEVYMVESVPVEIGFWDALTGFLGAILIGAIASSISALNVIYLRANKVLRDG